MNKLALIFAALVVSGATACASCASVPGPVSGGQDAGAPDSTTPHVAGGDYPSVGGDLSGSANAAKVVGIQGNPVSATAPSTGYVLTWDGGSWSPTSPTSLSPVTWANDLSTSGNAHQYVSGISGGSGAAGTVTLGTGAANLTLQQVTATGATAPNLTVESSAGEATAVDGGTASPAGVLEIVGGAGGSATGAHGAGAAGANVEIVGGAGGNGGSASGNAGAGADVLLQPGAHGTCTGCSSVSNGAYVEVLTGDTSAEIAQLGGRSTDFASFGLQSSVATTGYLRFPGGVTQNLIEYSTSNYAALSSDTSNDLTLDADAILQLGTAVATSIVAGNASTTTALTLKTKSGDPFEVVNGSTTAMELALGGSDFLDLGTSGTGLELTPNSIDSSAAISIGPASATSLLFGNSSTTTAITTTLKAGDQWALVNGTTAMAHVANLSSDFWGFGTSFGTNGHVRCTGGDDCVDSPGALDVGTSAATSIVVGNTSTVTALSLKVESGDPIENVVGGTTVLEQEATSSDFALFGASGSTMELLPTGLTFAAGVSSPTIQQGTPASDVATTNIDLTTQSAYASASTNKTAGSFVVTSGTPVSGGDYGGLIVKGSTDSVTIGTYGISGTANAGYGAIWFDTASPSSTNYGFLGSQGVTWLNNPSEVLLGIASVAQVIVGSGYAEPGSTTSPQTLGAAAAPWGSAWLGAAGTGYFSSSTAYREFVKFGGTQTTPSSGAEQQGIIQHEGYFDEQASTGTQTIASGSSGSIFCPASGTQSLVDVKWTVRGAGTFTVNGVGEVVNNCQNNSGTAACGTSANVYSSINGSGGGGLCGSGGPTLPTVSIAGGSGGCWIVESACSSFNDGDLVFALDIYSLNN